MIEVYTDGCCYPNPGGPGGWAWVVDESSTYDYGGVASSTNQRMEVRAAFEAIKSLTGPLVLWTDSMYVVNCATRKWKRKANSEMWEPFMSVLAARVDPVDFKWVKGHSGVELNEVADRLADMGRRGIAVEEYVPSAPSPPFVIVATRFGNCSWCGQEVLAGSDITQVKPVGWIHADCYPQALTARA